MELNKIVARNLRVEMALRKIKATEMSLDTGIARSTISKICQAKVKSVRFGTLEDICRYLGIGASELVTDKTKK